MPKYYYKCSVCENEYEVRHSITERLEDCKFCNSEGVLTRIPQLTNIIKKAEREKETGSLVKEYIEENKKILNQERKKRIEYDE